MMQYEVHRTYWFGNAIRRKFVFLSGNHCLCWARFTELCCYHIIPWYKTGMVNLYLLFSLFIGYIIWMVEQYEPNHFTLTSLGSLQFHLVLFEAFHTAGRFNIIIDALVWTFWYNIVLLPLKCMYISYFILSLHI